MKKQIIIGSVILLPILLFLIYLTYQTFDYRLSKYNGKGSLIQTYTSPDKKHQANIYTWSEGGATVGYSIRVGITSKDKKFKDETVFWQYKNIKNDFKWLSDTKFEIQGKKVDIFDTKTWYNWKRDN